MPRPAAPAPIGVRRVLKRLGEDVRVARIRRHLPLEVVAERALTTRQTVARVERGDPAVAMGTWATVLLVLGLLERLADVAAPGQDDLGLSLEKARLPDVVRLHKRDHGA